MDDQEFLLNTNGPQWSVVAFRTLLPRCRSRNRSNPHWCTEIEGIGRARTCAKERSRAVMGGWVLPEKPQIKAMIPELVHPEILPVQT